MPASTSVYKQVIAITRTFLGGKADEFIDQQIEHHLHKRPSSLSIGDLTKLIDWIQVSVSMIIVEREVIQDYLRQLEELVSSQEANRSPRSSTT